MVRMHRLRTRAAHPAQPNNPRAAHLAPRSRTPRAPRNRTVQPVRRATRASGAAPIPAKSGQNPQRGALRSASSRPTSVAAAPKYPFRQPPPHFTAGAAAHGGRLCVPFPYASSRADVQAARLTSRGSFFALRAAFLPHFRAFHPFVPCSSRRHVFAIACAARTCRRRIFAVRGAQLVPTRVLLPRQAHFRRPVAFSHPRKRTFRSGLPRPPDGKRRALF